MRWRELRDTDLLACFAFEPHASRGDRRPRNCLPYVASTPRGTAARGRDDRVAANPRPCLQTDPQGSLSRRMASVLYRPFDSVYDEYFDRLRAGDQFETELLLKNGEDRRGVGIDPQLRTGEANLKIKSLIDPRSVDHPRDGKCLICLICHGLQTLPPRIRL